MTVASDRIVKTPGVCGGDARVRDTRYTVWGLLESRRQGLTDQQILAQHPTLTPADLEAVWEYSRDHPREVALALWENEVAGAPAATEELVCRGRALGLSDGEIEVAFDPPLTPDALRRASNDADAGAWPHGPPASRRGRAG